MARARSRRPIWRTSGPTSTSSRTRTSSATANESSATAWCARRRIGRAEGYVHPDALGRGIGTRSPPGSRRTRRAAAHASATASSRPTPPPAGCWSRSATSPCASSARCASSSTRRRPRPNGPTDCASPLSTPSTTRATSTPRSEEAFAEHWDRTPRDFESWSKRHLASERFDPTLWCVVRAGDEIAAGTICTGDTYGGGFVHALFTRRPWRRQGVGAALLADAFGRFWERGERSVGLGVDAASDTGAFRLYERAGMTPALGWVMYEKPLGDAA